MTTTTTTTTTAAGTEIAGTIEIEFSVKLSDFGSMTESDKTKFVDDLKSEMGASLAQLNPFIGGTVEISIVFSTIGRQRSTEYEAVITVTYVAPATKDSGQVSANTASTTYYPLKYNDLDLSSVASSVGDVAKATMSTGDFINLVDQHDLALLDPMVKTPTTLSTTTSTTTAHTHTTAYRL